MSIQSIYIRGNVELYEVLMQIYNPRNRALQKNEAPNVKVSWLLRTSKENVLKIADVG